MGGDPKNAGLLSGARILVVEDDFFIAMELESIFTDAGADVVGPCRTVEEALAQAKVGAPRAALLDFRIGEDTSIAVAYDLQDRGVPFAFYTGQAAIDLIQSKWPQCKILAKPSGPDALVKAVAELLDRSPAR
jgi:DNA-binding NtrC family response regulator